jgi:stage II sporulation protein AA (anti-sigma F factor antagonist)
VDAEGEAGMSLTVAHSDADGLPTVVTIGGDLEYGTASPLRTALLEFSQGTAQTLVLDMRGIEFLDSTGISLLIQAKQRFDAQGTRFVLRQLPARVMRVLEIAGVVDMFTIEA